MDRHLIGITLLLTALSASLFAAEERHIEGLPFVFEHRWGEREDGTQFDRWRAAAGLWNTERITAPDGTEGRRWWIAPLFEYMSNVEDFTEWSLLWPAPLLRHRWRTSSPESESSWSALLWLFHWRRAPLPGDRTDLDWWAVPLYERRTEPDEEMLWSALWPPTLLRWDVDFENDGDVVREGRSALWLWGHRRRETPGGDTSVLWHVIPLFLWDSDSAQRSWEWWSPFPLPLASVARRLEVPSEHTYVFPFLTHSRGEDPEAEEKHGWGILPFHYRSDHRWTHEGQSNWSRLRISPPWFRQRASVSRAGPDGEQVRIEEDDWGVLPVTWGRRDGALDHLHVYPILFWKPGEWLTVFPLFWWGEDHLWIVPLYGRWESRQFVPGHHEGDPGTEELTRTQFFLFPLWLNIRKWRGDEVWSDARHILWPLFLREDSDRSTRRRALPFFARETHTWGDGSGSVSTTIPLLLYSEERDRESDGSPDRTFQTVFPLWWRERDYHAGDLDTQLDLLIPLFGRWRDWAGERLNTDLGLYGLYWRARNWTGETLNHTQDVLFPLYWDLNDVREGRRRRGLLPLWFRETVGGETRRLSVLWPLIQMRWPDLALGETENPTFALRVLWLLGGYECWADGDTVIDLLGGPLWHRDREGEASRTRLLWRLWARDTDPEAGTNRMAVLGRLFEYEREGDDRGLRLLYLPWQIPLP